MLLDRCRYCKKPYTEEERLHRMTTQGYKIAKGMSQSELKIGRPRKIDHKQVLELWAKDYSLMRIARVMGISKGSVQYITNRAKEGHC